MNRRQFLGSLGVGTVGLLNVDSRANRKSKTTSPHHGRDNGRIRVGQGFGRAVTTSSTETNQPASDDVLTVFEEAYEEAKAYEPYYGTARGIYGTSDYLQFFLRDYYMDAVVRANEPQSQWLWCISLRSGNNPVQVAQVVAAVAGSIYNDYEPFKVMKLDLMLDDGSAQVYGNRINQSYQIPRGWVKEFVNDERSAEDLIHSILENSTTEHKTTVEPTTTPTPTTTTTTETPTTTEDEVDEWTYSHETHSDGTLELVEDALEGGYTLWATYGSYSTRLWGVVENISGHDLDYAEVRTNLYVNGSIVSNGLDNIANLPAGHRWQFEALSTDSVRFDHVAIYLSSRTY